MSRPFGEGRGFAIFATLVCGFVAVLDAVALLLGITRDNLHDGAVGEVIGLLVFGALAAYYGRRWHRDRS
jgi:hypothetical protein